MIAIGSDHAGFELKQKIVKYLSEEGVVFKDYGTGSTTSVDYPVFAREVCGAVVRGEADAGILICGTGIGMCMAANKIKGVRAATCNDAYCARLTRMHNDANVLCVGARVVGEGVAIDIIDEFLNTKFEGGKHSRRVSMIMELEK